MPDENEMAGSESPDLELTEEFDAVIHLMKERTTRWDQLYQRVGAATQQVSEQVESSREDGTPSEYQIGVAMQQRYLWSLLQVAARLGRDLARIDDRLSRVERKLRTMNISPR